MAEEPALEFSGELFERMRSLGEQAYPFEGCGVLLGREEQGKVVVSEVRLGRNLVTDRRNDRYELDPRDLLDAERAARARAEEVVGFYHTHPDHPARPSQFDTDRAWPGYHYVVMAVHQGQLAAATAWRLGGEGEARLFQEVALQVTSAEGGYNPRLVADAS